MPRWKATEQLLSLKRDGEVFEDNWMDRDTLQMPPSPKWAEERPMRVEDVDIWEVITEMSGPVGVYAAWCPYGELYIVTHGWRIVQEFSGWMANERLEQFLLANGIQFPRTSMTSTPAIHREVQKTPVIYLAR